MVVLLLLAAVIFTILNAKSNGLWNLLRDEILKAVAMAEEKWTESGTGAQKRQWVIDTVTAYVESRVQLSWVQRLMLQSFVGAAADAIVAEVNERLGKKWTERVDQLLGQIGGWLPT